MTPSLHPATLAIRGAKYQTEYNEHNQALFITSSFMFDSLPMVLHCLQAKKQVSLIAALLIPRLARLLNVLPSWNKANKLLQWQRVWRRFKPPC